MAKSANKGKKGSGGAGSANNKKQNSGNANANKQKMVVRKSEALCHESGTLRFGSLGIL